LSVDEEKDISGVREATLNCATLETPPPGDGFVTLIDTFPLDERLVAGTDAVNAVLDVNVVCSGTPFQLTTEASVNPKPFMVNWNPRLPCGAEDGAMECTLGTGFEVTGFARLLVSK
jgi:hypothetical protein